MPKLRPLAIACLLASSTTASAEILSQETQVHSTTTRVEVTLSDETVLCSAADYSGVFLKVLIPELSALTLLDHQNTGAGAPCVASGACAPGNEPSDVIDPADPTEVIDVTVTAARFDEVDTDAETCNTYLVERVATTIRGHEFRHERSAPLGSRPVSDCLTSAPDPISDSYPDPAADDPRAGTEPTDEPAEEPAADPSSGGCTTSSGSGGLVALALAGLVLARRRRAS